MGATLFSVAMPFLMVTGTAALTAILIVVVRPVLLRHALAQPNARSSHRVPTPQGGGVAVVTAAIGAVLLCAWPAMILPVHAVAQVSLVFGACIFIALTGAVDDIRFIPAAPRLALQFLAVAIVIAALPVELRVFSVLPWWIERALMVVGGVWFVNLVNFMDGIDWMTVAEVIPVTAGLAILGAIGAMPEYATPVALALCGGILGFAPFNRPVARLFLGDVGSLPIGLLLGWMLVLVAGRGHVAAALLLPLYYLADATITVLRRLANGDRVWEAHRTHFYQCATDRGFTVLQVVARVFAVNAALVVLAVATVLIPGSSATAAALICGVILVAWLLRALHRGRP